MFDAYFLRGLLIPSLWLIGQRAVSGVAASRAFQRTLEWV
jgi:hypothetical protein